MYMQRLLCLPYQLSASVLQWRQLSQGITNQCCNVHLLVHQNSHILKPAQAVVVAVQLSPMDTTS